MKEEYKLTRKDYSWIKDYAHKVWVEEAIKHDYFVLHCYVMGFLAFTNYKNLKFINGKLYEAESS